MGCVASKELAPVTVLQGITPNPDASSGEAAMQMAMQKQSQMREDRLKNMRCFVLDNTLREVRAGVVARGIPMLHIAATGSATLTYATDHSCGYQRAYVG